MPTRAAGMLEVNNEQKKNEFGERATETHGIKDDRMEYKANLSNDSYPPANISIYPWLESIMGKTPA